MTANQRDPRGKSGKSDFDGLIHASPYGAAVLPGTGVLR